MPTIDEIWLRYVPELILALVVFYFWRDSNSTASAERKVNGERNAAERKERDEMWQKFWSEQRTLDREMGMQMSRTTATALHELSEGIKALDVSVQALYTQGRDNNTALSRTVNELASLRVEFKRFMGKDE